MKKVRRFAFGSRKRAVISVVAVIALVGAASAFAWLIAASGSGQAAGKGARSTDYSVNVTLGVTPAPTPADADTTRTLRPEGTGFVYVSVSNPSTDPVTVTNISQAGAATVMGKPSCDINPSITVNAAGAKLDSGVAGAGPAFVGSVINGGQTVLVEVPVSATAALPSCIASTEYRVPVSVTASGS